MSNSSLTTIQQWLAFIEELLALWAQLQNIPAGSAQPGPDHPLTQWFTSLGQQVMPGADPTQHANIGATVAATMLAAAKPQS